MNSSVSCIIRTYNEAKYIGQVIETIRSQKTIGDAVEIIVVDSGSTDDTVDIAKNHGVKLIEIPKEEFNYSRSLNLGIKNSTGDLIAVLSAHSVPCTNDWLQKMVANFKDANVAGLYCRQTPWPDADLHEIMRIERMFGKSPRSFSKEISIADMNFSNAASCIRRSVWEKHPFVIIPACEDKEWAQWAIENGYTIIYDAGTPVYHSHNESSRKVAERLIELEKATDIRLCRKRNMVLTSKQSVGLFARGVKQIISSSCSMNKRVTMIGKCITRSFWYVVDFSVKSR